MNTITQQESLGQETPAYDPHGVSKDKAWKALGEIAKDLSLERPSVGKNVIVSGGRKHKGKTGIVFYHGMDKYCNPFRYCTDMQATMRLARGKFGYCVGIKTELGEKFFTSANNVNVF